MYERQRKSKRKRKTEGGNGHLGNEAWSLISCTQIHFL